MKDLQELKTWLDAERSKAYDEMQNERGFDREEYNLFKGMYQAFDLCFGKAELLSDVQPNNDIAPPLQQADVSGSANDLQLDDKRTNAVGRMCEMFASGEYTLREILFAMCYLAEAGYE